MVGSEEAGLLELWEKALFAVSPSIGLSHAVHELSKAALRQCLSQSQYVHPRPNGSLVIAVRGPAGWLAGFLTVCLREEHLL
jgi:hypothetical protein